MSRYPLTEARSNLPKLVDRAEAGEEIVITRYGRVAARLVGPEPRVKPEARDLVERARSSRARRGIAAGQPMPALADIDADARIADLRRDRDAR